MKIVEFLLNDCSVTTEGDGCYVFENKFGSIDKNYGHMCEGYQIIKLNTNNNCIGIYRDGGTRKVFNGKIETIEQLEVILTCIC